MKIPETKDAALHELHNWQNIIRTDEWVVFRKLLKEHAEWLQGEANKHLRKNEDRQAGETLRAMDDCNKILNLVTNRINELTTKAEKGE